MDVRDRALSLGLRASLALPAPARRLLAGPPVVLDGQRLDLDTQLMLRLDRLSTPPVESLPVAGGREVVARSSAIVGGRPRVGGVRDLAVAGLPARLYAPAGAAAGTPLLLFLHGGGFVYGDLDSHDAACRVLAEGSGVRVLSVAYRLAPEHPFPAAYDDALAAFRWVVDHARDLGADPARLAVGGDSAGGNLAAGVARVAAADGLPLAFQLLVYPATDSTRDTRSLGLFGRGFWLTTEFMALSNATYLPDPADRSDPRASPLLAEVPPGLAPAYVATAGFDPLRDEGEAYARALADAGVAVRLRRFPALIHGFLNTTGVLASSRVAVAEVAAALRSGLVR